MRLIRKADGTFRRVAFLGFKHEEDAQSARDYFDKTYLDISKLRVDLVVVCTLDYRFCLLSPRSWSRLAPLLSQGTKDAPLARPNKRSREKGDSAFEGEPSRKRVKLADREQMQDSKKSSKEDRLGEFTRIMLKKHAKKADWAADMEVDVEDSKFINHTKEGREANDQTSSEASGADSDGNGDRGNAEDIISDTEWMRRRMGGVEINQKAFEQSDDEDEITEPEIIQVYLHFNKISLY